MPFSDTDRRHMADALRLAEAGAFTTKPNPMVGCVIAHGDEVVGRGAHERAGQAHAEVLALKEAGELAIGATAYVTLEPCAHHGRTPPCAEALVQAGVGRVVAAIPDPFHAVAGRGLTRLQAAGVEVDVGLMAAEAEWQNRGFLSRVRRGRPWVRVKLAMSLDGRTAMASGESKWITGPESRADVQRARARSGALLTGLGTVLADDPRLTVRLDDAQPFVVPWRVVLDPAGALPANCRLRDGEAPTLVFHGDQLGSVEPRGIEAVALPCLGRHLDLAAVLAQLGGRGINELQVEAGAGLAGALLRGGWIDELLLYVAPRVLGERGRPLFGGLGLERLAEAIGFRWRECSRSGEDLKLVLVPAGAEIAIPDGLA